VPDLTLLLDLPVAVGLARRHADGSGEGVNRLDAESLAFHTAVRAGYLELARAEPARWRVVDAAQGVEDLARALWALVGERVSMRDRA
jgi:dTMP kinase